MMIWYTLFLCNRYHSLHHTQFRTNYSLFMPFYDYIYGTMDKSSDTLYEKSLQRKEELPNVVYLTHLMAPESIYYTRLGFASLASKPHTSSKWYSWILWPVTVWSTLITRVYGKLFVVERNVMNNLKLQTWIIPKYNTQVWILLFVKLLFPFQISRSLMQTYLFICSTLWDDKNKLSMA